MNKGSKIIILSSFAQDRLFNKRGQILREQQGGPAYFIQSVFEEESANFEIPYQSTFEVEILITNKGEFGRIKSKPKPTKVSWQSINQPTVLVSSILDEFSFDNIEDYKGQVFIDVQGYVRDATNFGKKKFWDVDLQRYFCVKGTREEISYLPRDQVNNQKQKMLLVTIGAKGSILYFKGKKITAKPVREMKSADTIGAGDTFLAYFVARYLQSSNPEDSLKYATLKTSSFLSLKTRHHTNPF